ncbi:hypothetical protein HPB50_008028 [Hyalomma asiaticum]|uniref:Uncharacterized protein n=1 Tax=Hyalomma asiaticum TaxID=266040 RepID=A0ACB7SEV1_HYAAI|nr:hypothetical protein HPB50_008028 [Hyalomma asiaticum]
MTRSGGEASLVKGPVLVLAPVYFGYSTSGAKEAGLFRDPGDAVLSRNCNSLVNTICSLLVCPAIVVTAVFLLLERTRDPKLIGLRAYEEADNYGLADWGNVSDFLPSSNHATPLRGEILDVGDVLWNVDVNFTEEEPDIPVKCTYITRTSDTRGKSAGHEKRGE